MTRSAQAPSFPSVPAELLSTSPQATSVAHFLAQAESWRRDVRSFLATPDAPTHLSAKMVALLRTVLDDPGGDKSAISGRPISTYPESALRARPGDGASAHNAVLDVLVWRSQLVHYLSDVWDVIGPPAFEMKECEFVIQALLHPEKQPGVKLCIDCLEPQPTNKNLQMAHYDKCVVRCRRDNG